MTAKTAQIGKALGRRVRRRAQYQTWEKNEYKHGKRRVTPARPKFLAAPPNGDSKPDITDRPPRLSATFL
jgi:hypothetical protein